MSLSDTKIRNAKPDSKPFKLTDERGLYLLVNPNGSKWWRFDYRLNGKRRTLSMGVYPDISLAIARERREDARRLVAQGIDPSQNRKAAKASAENAAANSFEVVAREWYASREKNWATTTAIKALALLENDLFPWLGRMAVSQVSAKDILDCLRRIEDRGAADTAHRALQTCNQILRYAISTDRAAYNVASNLKGALPPRQKQHFPAIVDPKRVGDLMVAIDNVSAGPVVKSALRLAPLLFARPGELRSAQWADIDFERREWRYVVSKTKTSHAVPLSTQAMAILKEIKPLTGRGKYVFPGERDIEKPMSGEALAAALRRAGYDTKNVHTAHGFRAMARTILHEELRYERDAIELQLAHRVPDALGTAYNRTRFLSVRTEMMQAWADYLDRLKAESEKIASGGHSVVTD